MRGAKRKPSPATELKPDAPTSFQVFVQAVFDNGQKGGRVLIAEADWQVGSVEDNQPGERLNHDKSFVRPEAILTLTQRVLSLLRIKVTILCGPPCSLADESTGTTTSPGTVIRGFRLTPGV
jgi:hypothetical protein